MLMMLSLGIITVMFIFISLMPLVFDSDIPLFSGVLSLSTKSISKEKNIILENFRFDEKRFNNNKISNKIWSERRQVYEERYIDLHSIERSLK